ncbi:MAG: transposase, partial [Peptococcaceae bacterium]|nr:transposase [Peptococcaceae bacterium]
MLRIRDNQINIWESILPESVKTLPVELAKVDEILNDPRFMKPFFERFNTKRGRPTLAIQTYLRLMYLKQRYQLGYESLVKEVGDSITWRLFCQIA